MKIPVLISFARSGGTLVNQLIGVHPDCLVLSEVNPAASVVSIGKQASDWLGLIRPSEETKLSALIYGEQINYLNEIAVSARKTLVIRDWVTVNYLQGVSGYSLIPSNLFEQMIYLSNSGLSLQPLVVTRRADKVYKSIYSTFSQFSELTPGFFSQAYYEYAKAVRTFPRVSLEDLQCNPRVTLVKILQEFNLSLDFIDNQLENFADFQNCTGNNTLKNKSKSSNLKTIIKPAQDYHSFHESIDFGAFNVADQLLGYQT